jgi:protein Mpv17
MSASSRFFHPQGVFSSKKFFAKFKHWMEHHPVVSNSFLCLNLWIAGDILAQYSEHKLLHNAHHDEIEISREQHTQKISTENTTTPAPIDYTRTVQCASYGAFEGPLSAVWYPYLDRLCNQYKVAARFGVWGAPILKVFADEVLMDPPCLLMFYGYMNVCEGGTLETYEQKLRSEFVRSWLTGLAVWPVVLLGTFRYLPVYAQAPLINVCCVVWDGFLSHRNAVAKHNKKQQNQQQNAKEEEEKEPTLLMVEAVTSSSSSPPGVLVALTAASTE